MIYERNAVKGEEVKGERWEEREEEKYEGEEESERKDEE